MARLSIEDLNNLSGVSSVDLDTLHKAFKKSYTKILNDIRRWVALYNVKCDYSNRALTKGYSGDEEIYRLYRELYYLGVAVFNDIDLFSECTTEYQGLLYKLGKYKGTSELLVFMDVLNKEKKPMVEGMSNCYGIYQEAYERLNKEEYNEG